MKEAHVGTDLKLGTLPGMLVASYIAVCVFIEDITGSLS
jgi:hypothetical protein